MYAKKQTNCKKSSKQQYYMIELEKYLEAFKMHVELNVINTIVDNIYCAFSVDVTAIFIRVGDSPYYVNNKI